MPYTLKCGEHVRLTSFCSHFGQCAPIDTCCKQPVSQLSIRLPGNSDRNIQGLHHNTTVAAVPTGHRQHARHVQRYRAKHPIFIMLTGPRLYV